MTPWKSAAIAAAILAIVGPGLSRPAAAQRLADARPANDGPYAGASRQDFYRPDDRIKHIQSRIEQGGLAGSEARRALAQLNAIHQDLKYRIARHNGDLRDWDRELINQKLDALVNQYPALRS